MTLRYEILWERRLIVYRSGAGEEGVKNYFDTKDGGARKEEE